MNDMDRIRDNLLKDGINYTLVMKMTDDELKKADGIDDYTAYNYFMSYLAHKYGM